MTQANTMNSGPIDVDLKYHVSSVPADETRIHAAVEWVLKHFDLQQLTVSIAIVDDPTIHELNRVHLDHDWPTDVISFVFENEAGKVNGEIIASADTASKLAAAAGWDPADELLLYIVHGLLHLAGMDDIEEEARKQMRCQEQMCLIDLQVAGAEGHLDRWDEVSY